MDWKTRIAKRALDVTGASIGLAVAAPLFPIVAAAVKLTSKGPILYSQTRCAAERRSDIAPTRPPHLERRQRRGYHTFQMYKFRTMRTDAERLSGPILAQKNDPRLTPVGGLLRKTRLDELPQLLHVLRGDMSLVGPRPERPELIATIEEHVPFFQERMRLIKPGITGLAQIRLNYDGSFGRQRESKALADFLASLTLPELPMGDTKMFANKLLFDLSYSAILENPIEALKTDLEVILKTPLVMLRAAGR
jgi:lipopolysaccharide/colanic/teichoic acid biosynthesis glycosyltransferase